MNQIRSRSRCNSCNNHNNNNNVSATITNHATNTNSMSMHSETLMKGLNALRCAEKLFDVTLIVESRSFKAHRAVLAACSDYFFAMFNESAFSEAHQSEIHLNGLSARGIELLLEYTYTSKLALDTSNVQDVLQASTHVQMYAVVNACSHYLETKIDMDNCVGIAALADMYALDVLKRKVYRFICSRLHDFALTTEFMSLTCEQLEHILSCNYPVNCTEQRVFDIALKYCRLKRVSHCAAMKIFRHVRFQHINASDLKVILRDLENTPNTENNECLVFLNKIVHKNILKQQQQTQQTKKKKLKSKNKMNVRRIKETDIAIVDLIEGQISSDSDDCEDAGDLVPPEILVNSRGMELALVKIGGFETNGLTNQISCFLPSKGKWENLTVIPHIEQCNYGTAVLGNDLFIVGGSYDVCLKEYIHPFGFRYCPIKNKWKTIAPILADRCRFSLNAMGSNYLYAVGGVCELNDDDAWNADGLSGLNCERYNAAEDCWENIPALSENRSQHAGVVLADKLYISGGFFRHNVLSTLWCFDAKLNKWQQLRSMPSARADHVLIAIDNRIYACGGWYEDAETEMRVLTDTIDVYDVATDEWTSETRNPMPKYYTGVSAIKRTIYFIGGLMSNATINRATSAVQCYDVDTKKWLCNSEWEYPMEVWECTCASFYIPREREDFDGSANESH